MTDTEIRVETMESHRVDVAEQQRKTTVYSFSAAAAVCIVVIGVWWMTRPAASRVAVQRSITSMQVTWQCPDGTTFEDRGSIIGKACPHGNRRADVRVTYVCPRHGDRAALVRYARSLNGQERVAEVSFRHGVWRPVGQYLRCPDCGARLIPKEADPFAAGGGSLRSP